MRPREVKQASRDPKRRPSEESSRVSHPRDECNPRKGRDYSPTNVTVARGGVAKRILGERNSSGRGTVFLSSWLPRRALSLVRIDRDKAQRRVLHVLDSTSILRADAT